MKREKYQKWAVRRTKAAYTAAALRPIQRLSGNANAMRISPKNAGITRAVASEAPRIL